MAITSKSGSVCTLLTGVCLGAAAMYFLDSQSGKRRRALLRDRVTHAKSVVKEAGRARATDLTQRAKGLLSTMTSPMRRHDDSDDAVNARIRSRLGHVVRYPHALDTTVIGGRAVLRGKVLASELNRVLEEAARVSGVRAVENQLTTADESSFETQPSDPQSGLARYLGEMS